ncbi:MAG: LamG domain-containing protein [Sphaerochaetaceae bacterium]|nr:LamG domain-containing protein [Sphaerochaetaceae bacterium]
MKKRFFRSKSGAQSSIETIIILAMALFILTALTAIIYDQISVYKIEQEQKIASVAVNTIAKEINDAYFLGPGTIKTILVRMPSNIDFNKSTIENRTLVLNVGGSDIFASVKVDVRGVWPDESGTYSFTISAYDDYVSVSVRPVDVSPNQITQYLLQGESIDFDLVLSNGSDEDAYYSLILDFPSPVSSEAVLTSTHAGLVEVFYGETQTINFSVSCSNSSFGSYYGKIIFVPTNSSDANITVPVNLFCSSLQTKLKVYPSTKYFYANTNSITSDSVLACNTTSRDFGSTSTSVSGAIAPYVVTSFADTISANSCVAVPFTINAPTTASNYTGSLILKSGGFTSGVDLNLETYIPQSAITISWDTAYFGADGKSINDINLTTLTGPFVITNATVLFLNDIDDANVIGLYLSNQNKLPVNSKLISGEWSGVSDFNLARRKSYDLNITFDANIRNDSEKFRIILKGSDGTYYWSSIFDPTNSIADNNASHFSNLIQGQEPIYPKGDNLVSLWRMNDLNLTSYTTDVLGRNEAHVISATQSNGLWDKNAFNFDGSNSYIEVSDNDSLDLTDKWTISAWINRRVIGEQHGIVEKYLWYDGKGVYGLRVDSSNKFIAFTVNGTSGDACGTTLTTIDAGNWYNVIATFNSDTNTLACYVNSVLEAINTNALVNPTPGVSSIKIGARGDDATYKFNGLIDDVAIWDVDLTPDEVREIYSIGSGVHDFNVQADGNGLYLSTIDGNFVSDGNFYSRVFDFNGKVDFDQFFFTKSTIGNNSSNLFLKDNNLNNEYFSSNFVSRRVDNNAFVANGELDWNVLSQGSELVSSNYLFDANLISLWHLNDRNSDGWVLNSVSDVRDGNLWNGADVNFIGFWGTNSAYFDGVNDYAKFDLNKTLTGTTFTFSLWVRPIGAQSTKGIFQVADGLTSSIPWILLQRTTSTTTKWYVNSNYQITNTVNDNEWTHLALTFDGTIWRAYKNGIADGTYTGAIGTFTGSNFWLGNGYNGYYNGNIEEVAVWNKALSATDVNNLYKSQKGAWVDNNLISYYKFNSKRTLPVNNPASISNLALWISADSITGLTNGQSVSTWNDLSGNGRNFTQATGSKQPIYTTNIVNGLPVVRFTAANAMTMTNSTNFTAPVSVIYVSKLNGGANARMLSGLANNWLLGFWGGLKSQGFFNGWVTNSKSPAADTSWHIFSGIIPGSGSNSYVFADGLLVATNQSGIAGPNGLSLCGYYSTSEFSNGDIAEVIVYNKVLSSIERTAIESYLAQKYNLTTHSASYLVDDTTWSSSGVLSGATDTSGQGVWDSNATFFDGTNDFVQTAGVSLPTNTPFTFSVWVRPNFSSYQQPLIYWGTSSTPRLYWRVESSGRMYADSGISNPKMYWNGNLFCSSTDCSGVTPVFQNGVWYNLVLTGTYTGTALTNAPILIGSGVPVHAGRYFSGVMDEVKIYNRALSATEIALDYNKTLSSKFVDYNIVDASSTMNWNSVKVNSDLNYSFGKELSVTEKFGDGLIGLWHLNDKNSSGWVLNSATGIRSANLSGDADVTGAGLWDTNAGLFGGINGHVKCGNLGSFPSQGTISFWMNPSVVENYRNPLTTKYTGINSGIRFEEATNGSFNVIVGNDSGSYTPGISTYLSSGLTANNWYHVIIVWNKTTSNIKGYLNAALKFSSSNSYWPTTIPSLTIGNGFNSDRYWKGRLDEVAIWNRALTESEVLDLYRIGATRLDLNIYSCSDANCNTKTSSKYLENVKNNSLIDLNSTVSSSRYLGFDAYFKKAKGLEDLGANYFYMSSFIKDINFGYSPGVIDLFARTSTNGYSWGNWSSAISSSPNSLSLSDANFFQYKSILSSSVNTISPVLVDVNVTYSRISN